VLEAEIFLAEGAHVMLTRNLWTSKRLVNGSQGTVKKIWYGRESEIRRQRRQQNGLAVHETNPWKDLPRVVFVEFPDYTGKLCAPAQPEEKKKKTEQKNRSKQSRLGRN
jgi:hypothetical protein